MYKQHIKHVITLTKAELIDMLESRYGMVESIDDGALIVRAIQVGSHHPQDIKLEHGITFSWTTEKIPELPPDSHEDD